MQRSNRAALAAGVALGALSLTAPAWAQCTLEGGGVIECAPGSYNDITVVTAGPVELRLGGDIETLQGVTLYADEDAVVRAAAGSTVSSSEALWAGLTVGSQMGDVDVAVHNISATGGAAITAFANEGAVSVQANRLTSSGSGFSRGVEVISDGDRIDIDVDSIALTGAQGLGVFVGSTSGRPAINIDVGSITTTGQGAGVAVEVSYGPVSIDVDRILGSGESLGVLVMGYADDVNMRLGEVDAHVGVEASTNSGDIALTADTVSSRVGPGFYLSSMSGSVSATVDMLNQGLLGSTVWTNSGDIHLDIGVIEAADDAALWVGSQSGDVTIDVDSIAFDRSDNGRILNVSTYSGDQIIRIGEVTVGDTGGIFLGSVEGDIDLDVGDIIGAAPTEVHPFPGQLSGTGIRVRNVSGDISIRSTRAVTYSEAGSGISAETVSGDISIVAGIATAWEGNGIRAVSETGDISVVAGTVRSGEGMPLVISTAGAVSFTLAAGGVLEPGDLSTPSSEIAGDAGVSVLIQGAVQGDGDNQTPLWITRGALTLRNEGLIVGDIGANADVRFENAGVWQSMGGMRFRGDDDILINTGVIRPHYEESGCCYDPGQITLTGLETFQNAGLIDLRGAVTEDRLVALDTTYVGQAGAVIAVDFDMAAGAADQLSFGAIQGQTTLTLHLLGEGGGFAPAATVISSTAPASPDAIVLDAESATSGFITIALNYDADDNAFTLQALPSEAALANLRLGWAAQDYAAKSGEAWSGRLEDLRDSVWAGVGRAGGVEAWGQAVVGGRSQDQVSDFAILGATIRRDISSETDWRGTQYGMDRAFGPVLLGVTGGFLDYDMAARTRPDRFSLRGFNLGGYAAYLNGPFSLSGLAKVDRFESRAVLRSVDDFSEMDGTAWDAQVEAAWRFGGRSVFIEPVVSADFIRTDLDDLSIAGATASYSDLDSLRLKAGVRGGGRIDHGGLILTPSLGLYVTDERLGDTVMDFAFGTSGFSVTDHPYDAHGRADVGLGVVGPHGLAAYVKGEFDFGDGAQGATLRLGARWSW
ncbi:MAG: hypothetical protein EON88_06470 [Brevundimonas sp.]|nr:MAG: hypothetical protein EON88_06470 [Brevundimonas sp.]